MTFLLHQFGCEVLSLPLHSSTPESGCGHGDSRHSWSTYIKGSLPSASDMEMSSGEEKPPDTSQLWLETAWSDAIYKLFFPVNKPLYFSPTVLGS